MNYVITDKLFVKDQNGTICGGPYKNEESAKRRVRNLRQKDADALANVAACDAPATNFETGELIATVVADKFTIAAPDAAPMGLLTVENGAVIRRDAATTIAPPALPDAAKLAASSAYGKSNALAMRHHQLSALDTFDASRRFIVITPAPQRGVYPAISKNERRKRWNYA